ncbi:MAG: hypothetical protein Q4A72_06105 [Bacillota bacterium]|nr:hypothetical protein [Bacillota bacterium]
MAKGQDIDMVWAMLSCYEPMEKMVEMSGISEEEIIRIANENGFDLSYLAQ